MTNKARKRALRRRALWAMTEARALAKARYYSHVLYFPLQKPFDNPDLLAPSFVGAFVAPLVLARPDLLYWFGVYGPFAKIRVFTSSYEDLRPELESLRDKLGLVDKGEEKNVTLEEDLGADRFWGPNSRVTRRARAEAVLKSLKGAADLTVQSVVPRPDGYWEFERNGDPVQNPVSEHRFSVLHLFHHMMRSDGVVYTFEDSGGRSGVLSYIYFRNLVDSGQLAVKASQAHRVQM